MSININHVRYIAVQVCLFNINSSLDKLTSLSVVLFCGQFICFKEQKFLPFSRLQLQLFKLVQWLSRTCVSKGAGRLLRL